MIVPAASVLPTSRAASASPMLACGWTEPDRLRDPSRRRRPTMRTAQDGSATGGESRMDDPTYAVPEPAPPAGAQAHDPLAVALGNASLLSVGYLILGRRKLAVAAGLVTIALVSVLVSVARPWCQVVVLVWWA